MEGTDIDVQIGTGLAMELAFENDQGEPSDLTGYTPHAVVKQYAGDVAIILDLDPTITDPLEGKVLISVSTSGIAPGVYVWDLILTRASMEPLYVAGGNIKFYRTATPIPTP